MRAHKHTHTQTHARMHTHTHTHRCMLVRADGLAHYTSLANPATAARALRPRVPAQALCIVRAAHAGAGPILGVTHAAPTHAQVHTRTHAHTHKRTHARMHARTRTHACRCTSTLRARQRPCCCRSRPDVDLSRPDVCHSWPNVKRSVPDVDMIIG